MQHGGASYSLGDSNLTKLLSPGQTTNLKKPHVRNKSYAAVPNKQWGF
jgi:hypothetical protein